MLRNRWTRENFYKPILLHCFRPENCACRGKYGGIAAKAITLDQSESLYFCFSLYRCCVLKRIGTKFPGLGPFYQLLV